MGEKAYPGEQGLTWQHAQEGGQKSAARQGLPATGEPGALSGKPRPAAMLQPTAPWLPSASCSPLSIA